MLTASAPGKVVLSGEYAVLDGAPAIGMAINRRARVQVTDISGDINRVSGRGYSDAEGQFRSDANGLDWSQGKEQFALVDAVWRAVAIDAVKSKSIILDSEDFIDLATRRKTGIGSSAALTVALSAALTGSDDVAVVSRRAHADFQGGAGSGIDIACSINGGLIEYRMDDSTTEPLQWPAGLLFRVLWTGIAASTRQKLGLLGTNPKTPSRVRLAGAAERIAEVWRNGDVNSIISEYRTYTDELQTFSADHKLGIFDAGHDELFATATAAGLTYKPCGAGGGDIGIVFGMDELLLNRFVAEHDQKYAHLDCEIDHSGVRVEEAGTKRQ